MLVLKLFQNYCPNKIPCDIGPKLADGADGEVFEILNEPDKVIKFCVAYEIDNNIEDVERERKQSIAHLMQTSSPVFARVYACEFVGTYDREVFGNTRQRFILYYYIMEKLLKISDDEKKVFSTIISHEDAGKEKNLSQAKVREILFGLNRGLDFDVEKVIFFCENYKESELIHLDLHQRNVMKDNENNFRLIDFDRIKIKGDNYAETN